MYLPGWSIIVFVALIYWLGLRHGSSSELHETADERLARERAEDRMYTDAGVTPPCWIEQARDYEQRRS